MHMNEWSVHPLLVYCNAIGLPPLASRPARTALLSPVGPEGYLALGPRLTKPGAYPVHLVNPSNCQVGDVVRHGRLATL
jgi:hypothetical protein